MIDLALITGFDWDEGNAGKSVQKHSVLQSEAEQLFFNQPMLLLQDIAHSGEEARYHALGKTDDDRRLHVTFTLRAKGTLIRVISARDMNRKERSIHAQNQAQNP